MRPMAALDGPNARRHWAARHERSRVWRGAVALVLVKEGWPDYLPRNGHAYTVRFTVVQRRGALMDSDNLAGCLKAARDAVAEYLNVTDDPSGPTWLYACRRGSGDSTLIELEVS